MIKSQFDKKVLTLFYYDAKRRERENLLIFMYIILFVLQVHQEEFKGDAPSFVESSFSFDASQAPAEFYIYIPNPIDPKVNKVELTSPSGTRYTDQLSLLHDINVIKIDAIIDQPGKKKYKSNILKSKLIKNNDNRERERDKENNKLWYGQIKGRKTNFSFPWNKIRWTHVKKSRI